MTAKTVTATEFVRHFSEYVNRVTYRQESFVLSKGKKPVAQVRPVCVGVRLTDLPALLANRPRLSESEARSFLRDVRRSRAALDRKPLRDPWES